MSAPVIDLTQRPPRSPRVRLGGFVLLPRMLDKCRATLVGKNGEYNYACPLDQRFLNFTGIDPEALKAEVAKGKGDGEILKWVLENARTQCQVTINGWSTLQENRGPTDIETRDYFNELQKKAAPEREDIASWFDLLDVDDHISFGGKA